MQQPACKTRDWSLWTLPWDKRCAGGAAWSARAGRDLHRCRLPSFSEKIYTHSQLENATGVDQPWCAVQRNTWKGSMWVIIIRSIDKLSHDGSFGALQRVSFLHYKQYWILLNKRKTICILDIAVVTSLIQLRLLFCRRPSIGCLISWEVSL